MAAESLAEQAVLEKRRTEKAQVVRVVAQWWSVHLPNAKQALVRCILGKRKKEKNKNNGGAKVSSATTVSEIGKGVESKSGTVVGRGRNGGDGRNGSASAGAAGTKAHANIGAAAAAAAAAALGRVPSFPVSVEAMGSGTILLRELRVNKTMTVGDVKRLIEERLQAAKDECAFRVPRMQAQRLFKGHGGQELALNFRSLHAYKVKRGAVIVLGSIFTQARAKSSKKGRNKNKKKKRKPHGRVRLGAFGSEADFKVLMAALRTPDPSVVMERLRLTPRHEPYWAGSDIVTKFFLDNLPFSSSILSFARRNRLPSLLVLEEWNRQLTYARSGFV